jgi:hydroxyethylthiazole kinase-like uncharacterized protein yjeF
MIPIEGQPILTTSDMRWAEECAIEAGSSVETLMENAGAALAEAVRRLAAGAPVLVICGRGNNGGDGYVAARVMKANGVDVRIAASGDPRAEASTAARAAWGGPIDTLDDAKSAAIVVDGLFGTGLTRAIEPAIGDLLSKLVGEARLSIAIDLPSGLDADSGEVLADSLSHIDLTLALGAVKPVHVLADSAGICGTVRVLDIGIWIPTDGDRWVINRPSLSAPSSGSTKYNRGMVAIIGGAMPGAAALAAEAALRAGAGYALLLADKAPAMMPHAVVCRGWSPEALNDKRIGAIVVGPGLGRDDVARARLDAALATDKPVVVDGDALHLLEGRTFADRGAATILTPHGGEFSAMYGEWSGSKLDVTRDAADRFGAVVVFKGADTVIADTNGRVSVAPNGPAWLSTAGTGDVLAGTIGAMATSAGVGHTWFGFPPRTFGDGERARVDDAVWLHAEAARRLGGAFIADDLARELSVIRASL